MVHGKYIWGVSHSDSETFYVGLLHPPEELAGDTCYKLCECVNLFMAKEIAQGLALLAEKNTGLAYDSERMDYRD